MYSRPNPGGITIYIIQYRTRLVSLFKVIIFTVTLQEIPLLYYNMTTSSALNRNLGGLFDNLNNCSNILKKNHICYFMRNKSY